MLDRLQQHKLEAERALALANLKAEETDK